MNMRDILLFGVIVDILEGDFDIDVEELVENEFGLTEECKEAISKTIMESEYFAELENDKEGFIKEELIKILKEIVDKYKETWYYINIPNEYKIKQQRWNDMLKNVKVSYKPVVPVESPIERITFEATGGADIELAFIHCDRRVSISVNHQMASFDKSGLLELISYLTNLKDQLWYR